MLKRYQIFLSFRDVMGGVSKKRFAAAVVPGAQDVRAAQIRLSIAFA
jgi:hypothetical protein